MKKTFRKTNPKLLTMLCLLLGLILTLFLYWGITPVSATEPPEEKHYYQGTIEDDFADDRVIIVLTKLATRQFLTYVPTDFPEIDCITVTDLSSHTVEWVEKKVLGIPTQEEMAVNVEKFRRKLSLEIGEKGKQNVLDAIYSLQEREDIISAEPSTPMYRASTSVTPNDPRYKDQWALPKIKAPQAWGITTGSSGVRVGVRTGKTEYSRKTSKIT